jgi:transcription elongation factor Elf1
MEVWYLCPRCFEDKVLVTKFVSGGNYQKSTVCGTFVCSNCGFTKDYELGVGGNFVFLQYRETGTWTGL